MAMQSPNPDTMIRRGVRRMKPELIGNMEDRREAVPPIGTPEFEQWQETGKLPVSELIGGYEEVTENGEYDA